MANWPTNLILKRSGYSEEPSENVIRSEMQYGPDKVRRVSTNDVYNISGVLFLSDDDLSIFDTFYLENQGKVFNMPHPRTEVTVSARFTDKPKYQRQETFWDVSLALEILP